MAVKCLRDPEDSVFSECAVHGHGFPPFVRPAAGAAVVRYRDDDVLCLDGTAPGVSLAHAHAGDRAGPPWLARGLGLRDHHADAGNARDLSGAFRSLE